MPGRLVTPPGSPRLRGVLVPAAMRLAGSANWWAPAPLRRLHERVGLREDATRFQPAGIRAA